MRISSFLVVCSFFLSLAQAQSRLAGTVARAAAPEVASVHTAANAYRKSRNLAELTRQPNLDELAQEHADRMARGVVSFSHAGFEDRYKRARKAIHIHSMAENCYYTTDDEQVGQAAVNGWIKSPGHHRNLIGNYRLTGVGVARSAKGHYFVVQLYAN